jgi:hypothetical protein
MFKLLQLDEFARDTPIEALLTQVCFTDVTFIVMPQWLVL